MKKNTVNNDKEYKIIVNKEEEIKCDSYADMAFKSWNLRARGFEVEEVTLYKGVGQ